MRYKVAIRFAVKGDLRFISHHDTMRLFERAVSRGRLPIRFSGRFNPRPKVSLPLPRAVGVASEADVLALELIESVPPGEVMRLLAQQLPEGVELLDARAVESKRSFYPDKVSYAVDISPEQAEGVGVAVKHLLAAESWPIQRDRKGQNAPKTIDLRSYLVDAVVEPLTLRWTVLVSNAGSIRPGEMLTAAGLDPVGLLHRVRRTSVVWHEDECRHPDAEDQKSS